MAQSDWKQYFFIVFDEPTPFSGEWFTAHGDARRMARSLKKAGLKVVGIGRVRGKVPEVQRWFAGHAIRLRADKDYAP